METLVLLFLLFFKGFFTFCC